MPQLNSSAVHTQQSGRQQGRWPHPWLIVIVIVVVSAAPWLNSQLLAALLAVLGGTLPVVLVAWLRPLRS